jgi:uncharacterized membrane protein
MKLLGHPIHQQLIVFPLGLLSTAVIFDVVALFSGNRYWFEISFWMMGAGIIGGLLAAIFGAVDWWELPANTRAKRIGLWHGGGNVLVTLLFIVSWLLRRPTPQNPGAIALTLAFVGVAIAMVSGWLGGELVDRLGVGVDEGANLNAPSSLTGKPARPTPSRPDIPKRAA